MTHLRPIIEVRELPPSLSNRRRHLPRLCELVSGEPGPHESDVLSYLRQGVCCGMYGDPGLGRDVLQKGKAIGNVIARGPDGREIGPQLSYTDGTWTWWGSLLYYVATYHLRLPEEFLRHAERHGWRVDPSTIDLERLDDSALDATPPAATAAGQAHPAGLTNGSFGSAAARHEL